MNRPNRWSVPASLVPKLTGRFYVPLDPSAVDSPWVRIYKSSLVRILRESGATHVDLLRDEMDTPDRPKYLFLGSNAKT